jgi:hypothetical protein
MMRMGAAVLASLFVLGATLPATQSYAQSTQAALTDTKKRASASQAAPRVAKPYFVEFRARSALSYGHTFAVYGRVGAKIPPNQVVGLHPFTESAVPWMIGHLVPVPSETGASDGDTEDVYIIARYRVLLSEPEYKKMVAYIKDLQASSPVWHAVLYNCNAFVADIAKSIGLKTPSSLNMPKEFITELKQLNTGVPAAAAASAQVTIY